MPQTFDAEEARLVARNSALQVKSGICSDECQGGTMFCNNDILYTIEPVIYRQRNFS